MTDATKKMTNYFYESWRSLLFDYKKFREGPQPEEKILGNFRAASLPAFGFYFMLSVSTLIATYGLIGNSAATIIGAMIISPLMNPIITLAFGITTHNRTLIDRGCFMLFTGIPLVILVSYLASSVIGIRFFGSEVTSRAHPNYLDLIIAIGSGTAAAFAYSRQSIANALPGVAVAVALMPPLCVVGVSMHSGLIGKYMAAQAGIDENMALGALTLFLTNLWGILFASIIVFACQKYGKWKYVTLGLTITVVMLLLTMIPLSEGFHKMYIRELFNRELLRYQIEESKFSEATIHSIDIRFLRDKYRIQMTLLGNKDRLTFQKKYESQRRLNATSERLAKKLGHPVLIEMNIVPMEYLRSDEEPTS